MIRVVSLAVALAACALPVSASAATVCADLVVVDANVRTLDAEQPRTSALATMPTCGRWPVIPPA